MVGGLPHSAGERRSIGSEELAHRANKSLMSPMREGATALRRCYSAVQLHERLALLELAWRDTSAEIEEAQRACLAELALRPTHCRGAPDDGTASDRPYNFKLELLPRDVLLFVAIEFDQGQEPRS
jgi:hypothetical protein